MQSLAADCMRSKTGRLWSRLARMRSSNTKQHLRSSNIQSVSSQTRRFSSSEQAETTHFGFETVSAHEKEGKVRQVFERVAESYDVMNDLMSAGLHRYWKDYFVEMSAVAPMARAVRKLATRSAAANVAELRMLDVAGGTGDIAFRMIDAAQCVERAKSTGRDPVSVTVCDINPEMLRMGERRARERYGSSSGILGDASGTNAALSFCEGNAQSLQQFADNSFDLYTIAFGLRNVTDIDMALREACRVLKPGGRFMCLEFSQVPDPFLRAWYDTYSFHVIPAMGEMVANDRASYQYLVESIRRFSDQEGLVLRLEDAGFHRARYTNLTGGIVAIHDAWKPIKR